MGILTKADDWQVLGITNFGVGLGLAARKFTFDFFSQTADVSARFILLAFGTGFGGRAGGFVLPGIGDWTDLECKRSFSVNQLDKATGLVATATVGVGGSVGPCLISAVTP